MKFINIKDDSPKENKDYFVKVHPGTDDEYLDVFYWGGEYFSKRGIYFDLPMAFLDEQDEGWVPVESHLPKIGEYVFVNIKPDTVLKGRLLNNGWTAFFSDGETVVSPIRPVTHWMKQPAPPATKD